VADAGFPLAAKLIEMFLAKKGGPDWYNLSQFYSDRLKSNSAYRSAVAQYAANLIAQRLGTAQPSRIPSVSVAGEYSVTSLISERFEFLAPDRIPYPKLIKSAFIVE